MVYSSERMQGSGGRIFDLTKAFDSVPHWQLIAKLQTTGLNPYVLNWIKSYLVELMQNMTLCSHYQYWVPQGSLLGASLFPEYINDIWDAGSSNASKLVVFAITSLCISLSVLKANILNYSMMANTLATWSSSKLLKFNPAKYMSMLLSHRRSKKSVYSPLFL